MKEIKEMGFFELLDLEAWCDEKIAILGTGGQLYKELKEQAAAQREKISVHRCLEQFWAEKNIKGDI